MIQTTYVSRHALAWISEAYTHADMRFTQPPQAGVAPSHRRFRARHSSHASEARLRTDFFLGLGSGGPGPSCSLRLAGVLLLITAELAELAEEEGGSGGESDLVK